MTTTAPSLELLLPVTSAPWQMNDNPPSPPELPASSVSVVETELTKARKARKLPDSLDPDQVARLLAATETTRDRLIVETLLYTGLRVAEFCALEIHDIDWSRGYLKVQKGKGAKQRVLPVPARLLVPLKNFLSGRELGALFVSRLGRPFTTRAVHKIIAALAFRAKLPEWVSPHKLRHTYATSLLDHGANIREVQALLGHTSVETTQIYTHVRPDHLRAAIDRLQF